MLCSTESANITVEHRTAKSSEVNISKEILDLYEYIVGLSDIFLKSVISKSYRYVDIPDANTSNSREKTQMYHPAMDRMKIAKLSNLTKELQQMVEKLRKEHDGDKKQIVRLEQEVVTIQGKVKILESKQPISSGINGNVALSSSVNNTAKAIISK